MRTYNIAKVRNAGWKADAYHMVGWAVGGALVGDCGMWW